MPAVLRTDGIAEPGAATLKRASGAAHRAPPPRTWPAVLPEFTFVGFTPAPPDWQPGE